MALDWIGTLGTGAVGIIGIAATYWSGAKARFAQTKNLQLQLSAESERTRLAEKRRIYAAFMGAIGTYVAIERTLATARAKDLGEQRLSELRADLSAALTAVLNALCELRLIAPESLTVLSVEAVQRLTTSVNLASEFPVMRDNLYGEMRTDLGEPEHGRIEAPEIVSQAVER